MTSIPTSFSVSERPLAVVTGAASGIGAAITSGLLRRGYDVVAIDLDVDGIDPRALCFAADVRDEAAMASIAYTFAGRPVDLVFGNAGIGGMGGDAPDLPATAWQWAWEVNTLGVLRTFRLWWPHLCAAQGKAVATLSSAALVSFPGAGPYRASKAALLSALEGMHYAASRSGVSVHAMCPGMVRSRILDLGRYGEPHTTTPGEDVSDNPFTAHARAAMERAEPADVFAERVLSALDNGAPFYWVLDDVARGWIDARHRAIEQGGQPFADFGRATASSSQEAP